jgi:hypothetical protein
VHLTLVAGTWLKRVMERRSRAAAHFRVLRVLLRAA